MSQRLVITGTGRCGTAFVAAALNAAGVRCGHEQVYTLRYALGSGTVDWGRWQAESSWLAAPYTARTGARVVHLVRHPMAYVRSALEIGLFHDWNRSAYTTAIYHHSQMVARQETPPNRALAMWISWNTKVERQVIPAAHYQIETFGQESLAHLLGVGGHDPGMAARGWSAVVDDRRARNLKTAEKTERLHEVPPGWFDPGLLEIARQQAARYGYEGGWGA